MIKVNWNKVGMLTASAAVLTLLAVNVKSCMDANNQRDAMHQDMIEMKRLSDGIVRSQSKYVSKHDLESFGKNIGVDLDEIKKDLNEYDAQIKAVSKVLVSSLGRRSTNLPSSGTTPREADDPRTPTVKCNGKDLRCPDKYGHLTNAQHLSLAESFSKQQEVPIGSVTFKSWKEKPWSVDIKPRDYHVTTVLGQDKQGRHYSYHKFEIGVDGKKYSVDIKDTKLVEELPDSSFSWWNPRVGIGMHAGVGFGVGVSGIVAPTISASPFSYGQTEVKPTWVFARVGVGVDVVNRAANFSVAPAMWNIGSKVKFIQNTHVGPVVSVDTKGTVGVGVEVTTDF